MRQLTRRRLLSGTLLALLILSALTFAFRIQPAKSFPGLITVPDDYSTIQAAINAASPGDTVYVKAGMYPENVVVNKTLSLVGEDAENTTIDGGVVGDAVAIVADGVNMTGFTVRSNESYPNRGISLYNASYCYISGNNITNNYEGIYLVAGHNNTFTGNRIAANNMYAVHLYYSAYNFFSGNSMANNGYGIYVSFSSYNSFSGNNITTNYGFGVALEGCSGSTLSGNFFVRGGLYVWGSYGNVVVDNFVNGKPLVYLVSASDFSVEDAGQVVLVDCNRIRVENLNLTDTYLGVELWGTNDAILTGNNITNNGHGIWLFYSSNNTISRNNITDTGLGVVLSYSSDNEVSGNNITANYQRGILLEYSSNNTISGNNVTDSGYGVYLTASDNNVVSGNNVTANYPYGVWFHSSSGNIVSENKITNNYYGVWLEYSSNNTFCGNTFVNDGLCVQDSYGSVVVDNSVNGKPLVYLEGVSDSTVGDAGQVVLVDCDRIRVENLSLFCGDVDVILWRTNGTAIVGNNITSSYYGVWLINSSNDTVLRNDITSNVFGVCLQYSFNSTVSGNNVTDNYGNVYLYSSFNNTVSQNNVARSGWSMCGVYLESSSYNTVSENTLTNNYYNVRINSSSNNTVTENNITAGDGVLLEYSSDNFVSGNSMTGQYYGVWLYSASNNTVSSNDISNSQYGANIEFSSGNVFFHNNFLANTQQVIVPALGYTNIWDNGYPGGGNYWSDYNGTDLFMGAYQDTAGNDGIGDTPYAINGTNSDRYPLMAPLVQTGAGLNVTIHPTVDVSLTFDKVTGAGFASAYETGSLPEWMPPLSGIVGEYVCVTVTAGSYGNITVAVSYDDTNMTEEEENSLRLSQWSGCDVTGPIAGVLDGTVNMRDIGCFCSKFMMPGDSAAWDPRCDVTGPTPDVPDGIVNMRDIGEACRDFMETNRWVDITTYIDTVNNIIYGETTHFSMFGVTRW